MDKTQIQTQTKKIRVLFEGWVNIPHSYAIVFCFQLIHLYKNFSDKIDIYIREMPYYNPAWNNNKKLVYTEEYNTILSNLKIWNGEDVDLIYRQTFPYNITVTEQNKNTPKCVFYTSEFGCIDPTYFTVAKPPELPAIDDNYIKQYLDAFSNIHFTSPSIWSSKGILKYMSNNNTNNTNNTNTNTNNTNRNQIITHGVDTSIFHKLQGDDNLEKRTQIRKRYSVTENDILMINIGSMTANKGMMLMISALNILVNQKGQKQFKLLLKGSTDLYQSKQFLQIYFNELINNKLMTQDELNYLLDYNHIIFTEKTLSFNVINEIYNAADLYLSPYLAEGFNLTVLEALSSGLKVVVPETGSTREFIRDIYQNGGYPYITYVKSDIKNNQNGDFSININEDTLLKVNLSDFNGNFKISNDITLLNLVDTLLQNQLKLKDTVSELAYERMRFYIDTNYSWKQVSEMLYNYFVEIVKV
jgi:glycosyltransferase involved in cell wall biosynthesis